MHHREHLQKQIQCPSFADKQALQTWLSEELRQDRQPPTVVPAAGREAVETAHLGRITYQPKLVKCRKANCRCATGEKRHGSYWYGYCKENEWLKRWYIGKALAITDESEGDHDGSD